MCFHNTISISVCRTMCNTLCNDNPLNNLFWLLPTNVHISPSVLTKKQKYISYCFFKKYRLICIWIMHERLAMNWLTGEWSMVLLVQDFMMKWSSKFFFFFSRCNLMTLTHDLASSLLIQGLPRVRLRNFHILFVFYCLNHYSFTWVKVSPPEATPLKPFNI